MATVFDASVARQPLLSKVSVRAVAAPVSAKAAYADSPVHAHVSPRTLQLPVPHAMKNAFSPFGVAIDSRDGILFVTDPRNHAVFAFRLEADLTGAGGEFLWQHGTFGRSGSSNDLLFGPKGCTLNSDCSTLYVADQYNNRCVLLDAARGCFVSSFGVHGTAPGCFIRPSALHVSTQHLWVTDCGNQRVQKFDLPRSDGCLCFAQERSLEFSDQLGQTGQTGDGPRSFNRPRGLAVLEDRVFVADCDNNRVSIFLSQSGQLVHSICNADRQSRLREPKSLCVDQEHRIVYVCDFAAARLIAYDADTYAYIGSFGTKGEMQCPAGVASSCDRVFVTDPESKRILVWPAAERAD